MHSAVEIRDVAPGLWLWRQPHPDWRAGEGWEPAVASFVVESRGETILLDPLAPPPTEPEVWWRLTARSPSIAVVMKPDHVRDVDLFVRWFGVAPYGPDIYFPDDLPRSTLTPVAPGDELPGGVLALDDGRWGHETPLFLPEQRALVFADGMTAPRGTLRAWLGPRHAERVVPALRRLLELPFEHVLVSHGTPVHTRADFEAALEREPWTG